MANTRADFLSFINELIMRNPNLGIPALEDGLFANLVIFDYLYYIFSFGKGKWKGKGKRREKGKGIKNIARVPSCEVGSTVIRDSTIVCWKLVENLLVAFWTRLGNLLLTF